MSTIAKLIVRSAILKHCYASNGAKDLDLKIWWVVAKEPGP